MVPVLHVTCLYSVGCFVSFSFKSLMSVCMLRLFSLRIGFMNITWTNCRRIRYQEVNFGGSCHKTFDRNVGEVNKSLS